MNPTVRPSLLPGTDTLAYLRTGSHARIEIHARARFKAMSVLHIKPIHHATFDAEAVLDGSEIAVRFSGTADLGVKDIMDRFLIDVHAEASRMDVKAVSVDASGPEVINSA